MRRIMSYIDLKLESHANQSQKRRWRQIRWTSCFEYYDVQNRNIPLSYRTEKAKNMNFQLIFCLNAYLFLCWIWKAFKAQVCPHFSNTYYAPNTRQTRPFWIVSLHGTPTRLLRNHLLMVRFLVTNFHGDLLNSFDIAVLFRCRIAWYCYV